MTKSRRKYCSWTLLIVVHQQFSDCSFSLQTEEAAHTVVPLSHCCSTHWGVPDLFMVMVQSVWNAPASLHRPAKLETFLRFPSSFAYSSAQAWQLLVECKVGIFFFFLLYLPNKWGTLLLRYSWFLCLEINFWVNWILCDCMHNLKCSWNHHSRI